MLYVTQSIFIIEGKEEMFHEFENIVLPLLKKYNGKLHYRIRPTKASIIDAEAEVPYEIHLVSFPSEAELERYSNDKGRAAVLHLKNESVKAVFMTKEFKTS